MSGSSRSKGRSWKRRRDNKKPKRVKLTQEERVKPEPAWFNEALDDFGDVFGGNEAVSEEKTREYVLKWLKRCKTEEEEEPFEEAFRSWLLIRAVCLSEEVRKNKDKE